MKKFIAIILSAFYVSSLVIPSLADNIEFTENTTSINDQPANDYYSALSSDSFRGNGVIYVTIHHDMSDVGKVYTEAYFPELNIESIEDITSVNINDKKEDYGINFRNILKITLTNKDDNSVVNAIQKLQERANKDIYWAEPAYYYELNDALINSTTDTESISSNLEDYWESIIKYMDETDNNVVNYINSNITNFSERSPVKIAIVESGGVGTHDDFTITVQNEDGTLSEVSILDEEIDLRKNTGSSVSRDHATRTARLLAASSAVDNAQTISITSMYFGQPVIEDNDGLLDAETFIANIINKLNDEGIYIASMSYSFNIASFKNIVTATSLINNYKGLFIAACSNDGKDIDFGNAIKPFPAILESDNIISVGASNESDTMMVNIDSETNTIASGSNYGVNSVDIFAPGEAIYHYTTYDNEGNLVNNYISGTSYATPIVAGTAALMKYVNPNLTNLQIKVLLLNTVDRKDSFIGKCVSGGRLNAYEAVRIAHQLAQENPSLTQEDINKSNFLFHGSSNEIIKYVGSQTEPIIPGTINGITVSKIADSAFSSISYLKSINIPENITEIGEKAFRGCSSLESVTIPSSITVIPDSTFQRCVNLKKVILPDTITSIGENAFLACGDLESILLPPNLTYIATSAFDASIMMYVSYDASADPDSQVAYNYAISNGMSYCIVSGNTITFYSDGNNSISRDLVLPSTFFGTTITSIGNHAFDEADNIVSVEIPSSVTSIGYRAFRNCDLLRTVIIPSSVTSISNSMNSTIVEGSTNAIIYCSRGTYTYAYSLTTDATFIYVSLDDTNKTASIDGIKESSNGGTEYYIPETIYGHTVTSIASGAFGTNILDEKRVTKIYVPETVESIGNNAFSSCANLTDIYIYSKDTELGSNCLPPYNRNSITVHCYMPSPAFLYATGNGYNYNLL